jgi:hypothetical protein
MVNSDTLIHLEPHLDFFIAEEFRWGLIAILGEQCLLVLHRAPIKISR